MANKGMIKERITILGDKIRYCDFDGCRVYDTNDWSKAVEHDGEYIASLPIGSSETTKFISENCRERDESHKYIDTFMECDFDDINWDATPNEIWFEMCDKCIE